VAPSRIPCYDPRRRNAVWFLDCQLQQMSDLESTQSDSSEEDQPMAKE
jgi:hypothetical protein